MWKSARWQSIFQSTNEQEVEIMERQTKKLVEFAIDKLYELKIKTEMEDRKRGKKRYVSKASAYNDLAKLLEELYENN